MSDENHTPALIDEHGQAMPLPWWGWMGLFACLALVLSLVTLDSRVKAPEAARLPASAAEYFLD